MPSLSHSQSSTSVYLEFTDPSPTATPATVYTVSRNGAAVTSPNNNVALMTSFVDDDNGGGLDPGQTYEYTVTATDSDGSQRESNVMNMCTSKYPVFFSAKLSHDDGRFIAVQLINHFFSFSVN